MRQDAEKQQQAGVCCDDLSKRGYHGAVLLAVLKTDRVSRADGDPVLLANALNKVAQHTWERGRDKIIDQTEVQKILLPSPKKQKEHER